MLKSFQSAPRKEGEEDDDIEFFKNHPLNCRELTPEMLEKPEFKALQNLAYDGTPEEIATNFKNQAMETLSEILEKKTKSKEHEKVECERAMHFFKEAFDQDCKEPKLLFTLYMGRAKLNLLIAQFGKCKEDCLEALKLKPEDEQMWIVLCRSRYFIEKNTEGLKYARQGMEKLPNSVKILKMLALFEDQLEKERKIIADVSTFQALKEDKKLKVYRNLREKGIKLGKRLHELPEGSLDLQISVDDDSKLHFPVLLLYDEFMQTDFIQDWTEDVTLKTMLLQIFACQAPWDSEGDYTMQTIEVYYEADQTTPLDPKDSRIKKSNKKYVKLDLKMTLLEVLTKPNHFVPQYPVLKVISTDSDFRDAFLNEI